MDETDRILAALGVRTQVARVAFFSEGQARDFVRAKASDTERGGVAADELNDFLTEFFRAVGPAVGNGEWASSQSFLGYAPVLDALGTFYRDQNNPLRRLSEIRKGNSNSHVWELLAELLEAILVREAEKFGQNFGGDDERKCAFGEASYSPQAQLLLLLSDTPEDIEISPPTSQYAEDSWILEELMPRMWQWFGQHPFLKRVADEPNPLLRFAGAAFRDYSVASLLAASDLAALSRVRDYWQDPRVTPSPIFSRFCMSEVVHLSAVPIDVISMVVDSHATGFQPLAVLEIEVHDEQDNASLVECTLLENGSPVRTLTSHMRHGESLYLSRGIAQTIMDAPDVGVVVGSGAQDFVIGPEVIIRCSRLSTESTEVRVRGGVDSASEVRTDILLGSTRRVSGAGPDSLRMTVPVAAFPWQAYRILPSVDEFADADLYWAGMATRRYLKWFVRRSLLEVGGLHYPAGQMETILGKNRASAEVHEFLSEREYVYREGILLRLRLPGINGATVLSNDLQDSAYRSFLIDFIKWTRVRSLSSEAR
ncbi:hypothetical protein [Plantibacter flavus]|nr:hypothetical protein [Plantibacter flavus]